jgi:hypothetical protein
MEGWVGLVLWFINKKKDKKDGFWKVYLSSHFAEKLCPRRERHQKSITTLLLNAQILFVHKEARKGFYPTIYKLSDEWANFLPSNFKLNKWQQKRLAQAHKWAEARQYERHPCLRWIDDCIARITLPESDALKEALQSPNKAASTLQALNFLSGDIPLEMKKNTKEGYCGTFYSAIWSLPKEMVKTLLIDGEEIAQLDITAAHPSTLPRIILNRGKDIDGIEEEVAELTSNLETGRIYDQFAAATGLDSEKSKKRFLSALNGENNYTHNDPTFLEFTSLFPLSALVLRRIRGKDPKDLNIEMTRILATAVEKSIDTLWKYEIPVFPRGDELVCRKRDAEFVREVLAAYFLDETGVKAKVGKKEVTFIPNEEGVWQVFIRKYTKFDQGLRTSPRVQLELPLWETMASRKNQTTPEKAFAQ